MIWRRTDQVSPELAAAVFDRDREVVSDWMADLGIPTVWRRDRLEASFIGQRFVVCPAVVADPRVELKTCWGRWRIEHVKKAARFGKRAEPEMACLMALCQGHTEDGMEAGRVWATAHRNEQREYLAKVN